ncbi:hypothetical protein HGRIS_012261 [Hohenbuehelia grisea]|uniref:F-box domain-containing protein n=1 Tax=Hohenbuehelia grisea TaxID=104357 RepID=A0ABR3IRT4_9AGAR
MVSADNLNLDVLELVFAYLQSQNDLASAALVSRSFQAGVIPHLYRSLRYTLRQGKRFPELMTPFAVILAHPALGVHVRQVDIRHIPLIDWQLKTQPHPEFLGQCSKAISMCPNIRTFQCIPNVLSYLAPCIKDKARLRDLRIHASISTVQAKQLIGLGELDSLALHYGSWNVMDLLPEWATSVRRTLTTLTLYMSAALNETVLHSALPLLTELRNLSIIGCRQVDHTVVLRLVSHTPELESLAFTTSEVNCPLDTPAPPLRHLRRLILETRYTTAASQAPTILSAVLAYINSSSPSLTSFAIKFSSSGIIIGHTFVEQLLTTHGLTLRRFALINGDVSLETVRQICRSCVHLERLELPIPMKTLPLFIQALGNSFGLHTLIDTGDPHATHGPRLSLTPESVRQLMGSVRKLRIIENDGRTWKGEKLPGQALLAVTFEKKKSQGSESYWFSPYTSD